MTNFSNEMIFGWGRSLPGYAFHYSGFTVIEESSGFSEEYQNVDNQGFYPSAFVFQPPTGSDAYGNGVALAAAFIQASPLPPTLNVSLLDPVPDLLNGPAVMNGSQLQNSLTKGRVVSGVATDGVAQLVVRIDTNSPGEQFTVTLLNDQTPQHQQSSLPNEDGALDFPGSTTFAQSQLTVSAGNVSSDGLAHAFAVYRAPIDFARPTGAGFKTGFCAGFPPSFNTANTDDNLQCRSVYIRVQDATNLARTITVPVIILRPTLEPLRELAQ
jgi:hypothetical protein